MKLNQKKCLPCRGDVPPFTREQIDEYLKYLTDWKVLINEKKGFYLSRVYNFSNFEQSLSFINKVSNVAEEENHHPDQNTSCFARLNFQRPAHNDRKADLRVRPATIRHWFDSHQSG